MGFYFSDHYVAKQIGLVSLDHYSPFSSLGQSVLIRVYIEVEDYLSESEKKDKNILTTRNQLKEIAETLRIKI